MYEALSFKRNRLVTKWYASQTHKTHYSQEARGIILLPRCCVQGSQDQNCIRLVGNHFATRTATARPSLLTSLPLRSSPALAGNQYSALQCHIAVPIFGTAFCFCLVFCRRQRDPGCTKISRVTVSTSQVTMLVLLQTQKLTARGKSDVDGHGEIEKETGENGP